MWVTGGIGSEHILVIGVTRQCPAEGFYQKRSAPHSGPYSGKFLPRTGGGLRGAPHLAPQPKAVPDPVSWIGEKSPTPKPPPPPDQSDHRGKKRNLPLDKSGWAIFGYPPPPQHSGRALPQRHSHTPTPATTAFLTASNRLPNRFHIPNCSGTAPIAPLTFKQSPAGLGPAWSQPHHLRGAHCNAPPPGTAHTSRGGAQWSTQRDTFPLLQYRPGLGLGEGPLCFGRLMLSSATRDLLALRWAALIVAQRQNLHRLRLSAPMCPPPFESPAPFHRKPYHPLTMFLVWVRR